jgi:sRNA-binding carbon storage regulator CsrA
MEAYNASIEQDARGEVRVGIEAPREVPIYREELLPIVKKEKSSADDQENRAPGQGREAGDSAAQSP